jgi:hypothetical protein
MSHPPLKLIGSRTAGLLLTTFPKLLSSIVSIAAGSPGSTMPSPLVSGHPHPSHILVGIELLLLLSDEELLLLSDEELLLLSDEELLLLLSDEELLLLLFDEELLLELVLMHAEFVQFIKYG